MALENINPSCQEVSEMEKIFQKLECPFTWAMEKIKKLDVGRPDVDVEQSISREVEDYNLFHLMKLIRSVYIKTKDKVDLKEILNELKECDHYMRGLKEYNYPEISTDVVYYILQSTKCFVFKELNLTKELKQTFSEIKKDWKMNSKETSTLNACKSIILKSERFIRDAIKDNPNCALWYYILGKRLRKNRRNSSFGSQPSKEEIDSFLKAYNMSTNQSFGIFVAHMYRDMKRNTDAEKIYNAIFEQNPTKTIILLRLALGFIRVRNYTNAKVCLDKAGEVCSFRSMYLHYRGIYHFNLNEYEEAAKFFKEASNSLNIFAEKQYLECAVKLDKSFDIIQYLHGMIDKYNDFPEEQMQQLLLDLALTYWKKKDDIANALIYFLKAVETNPEAKYLTSFYNCKFVNIRERNIYRLLHREILPFVRTNKEKYEQSCIDRAEDIQRYCNRYLSKTAADTLHSFGKFNLRTYNSDNF